MMIFSKRSYLPLFLIGFTLFFLATAMAQPSGENKPPAPETSPEKTPSEKTPPTPGSVAAGPLELIPGKANLVLQQYGGNNVLLIPTIRFKIVNTSSSDVKLILFKQSIVATDNLGESLYGNGTNSAGIALSDKNRNDFSKAFQDEKAKFVTLAPNQSFEAQLMMLPGNYCSIGDPNNEFLKNHRPKTLDLSATLGIINFDGSTELRAFSFSEVPVLVSTR